MLHRIQRIISITPFTVICEWTNGEIRAVQMEEKIKEWSEGPQSVFKNLMDKDFFSKVKLDLISKTLYWDELLTMEDTSGILFKAPLDIDPEVLYEMSIPVNLKNNKDNIAA